MKYYKNTNPKFISYFEKNNNTIGKTIIRNDTPITRSRVTTHTIQLVAIHPVLVVTHPLLVTTPSTRSDTSITRSDTTSTRSDTPITRSDTQYS